MKTYNEIYPIEGWAEKISRNLTKIADEKPNMYAKTKVRYQKLAESLLDSVEKIAIILESDSLVPKSNNEFYELSDKTESSISDKLNYINNRVHEAENFSANRFSPTYPKDGSVNSLKETLHYFDSILQSSSTINFGYSEVNECARLLYRWFHSRFCPDIENKQFKFQHRYLPTWICNFIILYGKYNSCNMNTQFKQMIESWCDGVDQGTAGNYAVPYEIYQLEKVNDPADYTIDAVVMNDILTNECLYQLSDTPSQCILHYDHNILISVVRDRNPSLHSKIVTRIAKRRELIKVIGLTPVGGIEE